MNRTHSSIILGLVLLSILLLSFISFGGMLLSAQGEESMFGNDSGDSAATAPVPDSPADAAPATVAPATTPSPMLKGRGAPGVQQAPVVGLAPTLTLSNTGVAPATNAAPAGTLANAGPGAAAPAAVSTAPVAGTSMTGVASQGSFGGMVPLVTPVPAGGGGGVPVSRG